MIQSTVLSTQDGLITVEACESSPVCFILYGYTTRQLSDQADLLAFTSTVLYRRPMGTFPYILKPFQHVILLLCLRLTRVRQVEQHVKVDPSV